MSDMLINDQTEIKYVVLIGENVLFESKNRLLAEDFVKKLPKEVKDHVKIGTLTEDNKNILLG